MRAGVPLDLVMSKIKTPLSAMATWKMKRVLDRNRSLLKEWKSPSKHALHEDPAEWLVRRGFNFDFHTHIQARPDGKLAVMCFDEGYVLDEEGVQLLIEDRSEAI